MPEFKPGDVFVNHRIEGLAGRGGMGVVYRARDLDLDRVVALKVIAPALAEEPDFRARFVAESKAAASIEHPHVIPVYYAGEREGVLFIVMRYVDGPDLRALVRAEGRLEPERAAHVVAQVGGALDAAHAHGLVHRDVKPANVLLGAEDHAYLTDFGLTKRSASTGGVSRPGGWVGTLGFVAPEQIRGERVDARTDVYALGCVLVHALTGTAPYLRDSDEATLWAHLNAAPPTDEVPREFAGVVERALAKDPDERFPSAGDLGRAALAAAGRSAPRVPERNVARGAAAPEGLETAATGRVRLIDPDGETHVSPPDEGDGATGATALLRPKDSLAALMNGPLALAGGGLALGLVVLLAILLLGGGDDPPAGGPATTTATQPPPSRDAQADALLFIATRPNAITIAAGRVWALSSKSGEIVTIGTRTREPQDRIDIGKGGTGVAAGFASVWAVKANTASLIRISAATGRRNLDGSTTISVPGSPTAVATGEGAVWVGMRKRGRRDGSGESVVKIDPSTLLQESVSIPGGVQDLAVGEGGAWVTTSFANNLIRIDANDIQKLKTIPVGRKPYGVAVGHGAVWVAASGDDAINRINPRGYARRNIRLQSGPTRVAVGGGSVWVTARAANRLIRIDPRRRVVREEIRTGSRPFALDVTNGNSVWVTLLNQSAVQRIRFYR
jgi:streptogramin lyase